MKSYQIIMCFLCVFQISCEQFEDYRCLTDNELNTSNFVNDEKAKEIADEVCNTLNSNELTGIQVSIIDSIGERWGFSIGSTDLKHNQSLEDYHILRIGSVTKIYTATLILKLVENNYLQLDQYLSDFYPEFENAKEITIRNMLNHSSGIVDVFSIPSIFISATNFPDKQWNSNNLAETCLSKKLNFSPGTRTEYSNTNFILLGLIAEKTSGNKMPQLYKEYIINPLNLKNTYFVPYENHPPELVNGYVHHYALSLSEWYTNEPDNTSWATIGYTAGAMVSNAAELADFTYQLFKGNIINQASLAQMTSFFGNKGLGLFTINVNNNTYWGHEGEITGFEAITAYNPETKVVISITCNTTPFDIYELLNAIDKVLY